MLQLSVGTNWCLFFYFLFCWLQIGTIFQVSQFMFSLRLYWCTMYSKYSCYIFGLLLVNKLNRSHQDCSRRYIGPAEHMGTVEIYLYFFELNNPVPIAGGAPTTWACPHLIGNYSAGTKYWVKLNHAWCTALLKRKKQPYEKPCCIFCVRKIGQGWK